MVLKHRGYVKPAVIGHITHISVGHHGLFLRCHIGGIEHSQRVSDYHIEFLAGVHIYRSVKSHNHRTALSGSSLKRSSATAHDGAVAGDVIALEYLHGEVNIAEAFKARHGVDMRDIEALLGRLKVSGRLELGKLRA